MMQPAILMQNLAKATFDALGYLGNTYYRNHIVYLSPSMYDAFKYHPTVHSLYKDMDRIKKVLSLLPVGCLDIPKGDCFLYAGSWFCRSEPLPFD
jgi:hypothetical protein